MDRLLTKGSIRRKIIGFAIPIFIGYLFQQLYNTADSLIVGNYLGENALAAVSSNGAFTYLFIGFFMGFATGAGVVIARHIGANDPVQTSLAVHTTVAMGLVFSVLVSVLGVAITPTMLRWMGTPPEVFVESAKYLRVYFAGATGLVMYNMLVGILQASGDSRHPLLYLIISSLVNVALDVLFVAAFHMGVEGAAYATIISQFLSMLLVAVRLLRVDSSIRVDPRKVRIDPENLRYIVRNGLPTALQACVIDLSNLLIQSYINSFGSLAMAGVGASTKVEGFAFLPVTAFQMAVTTFVSQNMGAREYDRVRRGIRFGLGCTIATISLIGIVVFLLAPQIIGLFNRNPEVIRFGTGRARVCGLFYCLVGFSHVASAVMRGLGKPVTPMVIMLTCWCAVRILVLFTLGQALHDIRLAFWIYPFTWTLSSVVYVVLLKRLHVERLAAQC